MRTEQISGCGTRKRSTFRFYFRPSKSLTYLSFWVSLYRPGWPGSHDFPECVSQGLWLQAWATTSTFSWIFNSMFICYSYHLGKWKQLRCVCPHAHRHISILLNHVPSPESHFYVYDSSSGLPMVKRLVIMRGNNNDDITVVKKLPSINIFLCLRLCVFCLVVIRVLFIALSIRLYSVLEFFFNTPRTQSACLVKN